MILRPRHSGIILPAYMRDRVEGRLVTERHPSLIIDAYLTYGGGGGGGSGPTLNFSDKHADISLSGGDLTATRGAPGGAWRGVRSTTAKSTGKWYIEARLDVTAGSGGLMMGLMQAGHSLATHNGVTTNQIGWLANARQLYYNNAAVNYGGVNPGAGAYAGLAWDADTGKVWVRTSNVAGWLGGGNPAAGLTPSYTIPTGLTLYAALALYYSTDALTINLGATAFNMAAPLGFAKWSDTTMPVYTDTFWPQTVLLVPFTGADGSTVFTDSTGRHAGIGVGGNAQVDRDDSSFTTDGALMLDGVSDYANVVDNQGDFAVAASGSITFEIFYKARSFAAFRSFFGNYAGSGGGVRFGIEAGGGALNFRNGDGAANVHSRTVSGGITANVLHHAAYVRDGATGISRIFHNGVKAGADITGWNNALGNSNNFLIGAMSATYPNDDEWDGWLQYIRVTHAVRYWADFSVPARPLATV